VKRLPVVLALVLALGACGTDAPKTTSQPSAAEQSAALTYQTTGADMTAVLAQYQAGTSTIQDVSTCQSVEAAYQQTMGPIIDRMSTVSATMDQYMSGLLGPADADMGCVAAAMKAEFARHVAAACSLPDVTADRAEATQHEATMASWADHERVRYEQMGSALGMMPATTATTWACQHDADGSFTLNGHGWMMPPGSSTPATTPPPTPGGAAGAQTTWPMPCGGMMSACNGYGYPTTPPASSTSPATTTPSSTSTTPPTTPTATPPATTSPPTAGDPVALGQRIFMSGVGVDGQPLSRTGGSGMMMVSGCASCHGVDGHGLRTMMFTTPNITYANLTDPAGMLDPDGSRGPTYTDDLIRRAVTQGFDAAGDPLSTAMPHWQLADQDWNDLLQFLKTLQ
jgi:cytochrome c2